MPNKERWKVIPGFPDYAASTFGRFKRIRNARRYKAGRFLKGSPCGEGYIELHLSRNKKTCKRLAHQLILRTFIGPPPTPFHEGNHQDGIKSNNRLSNLEWATHQENMKHADATGLRQITWNKLEIPEVLSIFFFAHEKLASSYKLAAVYGVHQATIMSIKMRRNWRRLLA